MNTLTAADVVRRLDGLPPVVHAAPGLLARLSHMQAAGTLTPSALTAMQPEIEVAVQALTAHVEATERIVQRCKTLPPVPSQAVPAGF